MLRRVDWAGVSKAVVLLIGCKDVFRVLRVVGGIEWVVLGRACKIAALQQVSLMRLLSESRDR